jgi:hypothetical protein
MPAVRRSTPMTVLHSVRLTCCKALPNFVVVPEPEPRLVAVKVSSAGDEC